MEVRIKYELISKSTVTSISYNHQFNILAAVGDANNTATFFTLNSDLQLIPRFNGQSRPPSSGCINWSPNGLMIAVSSLKVQLWKFQGLKMAPLRVINQGFIQIKNLTWSHDSQSYLCFGINHKDLPISINIRHIESNQLTQIFPQDQPVMANFDPFGKYIAVLTLKNVLDLYDTRTLVKIRSINLAQSKNDALTLKDRRLGDWSPDYSYYSCINLNDNRIATSLIFDRNKNFAIKDILIGHQATISCTKFNPNVYQYQNDTSFILAVGDSSGCLSLWRISKNSHHKQPLFIMTSPIKAQQSIQSMQWNTQGDTIFLNVLKKYIIIVNFNQQHFGRKLSQQQKNNLIIATYGATGANQIASASLQVFGVRDFNGKNQNFNLGLNQNQNVDSLKIICQNQFKPVQKSKQTVMVRTQQQVIYNKDANNKMKKRIIPSQYVPQSQLKQKIQPQIQKQPQANQQIASNQTSANTATIATNGTHQSNSFQMPQKLKLPTLKIPSLKQEIKREYLLQNDTILQIQYSKNITILSIKQKNTKIQTKQNPTKRFFNQEIKLITFTNHQILVLSAQKLFVFDFGLELVQLPCFLGDICCFVVNGSGTVYYMTTNGYIRGFNYIKNVFLCQTSAAYLLMAQQEAEITVNPFSMFSVFDNDCDRLHVQLKSNLSRYFFCKQQNKWIAFDFDQGFYRTGHSLRITKPQKQTANNFYTSLITPAIIQSQSKNQSVVNQYQLQVIYYGKYVKDMNKFKDAILKMLLNLKIKGNDEQMRKQILKYFIDKNSKFYINDTELWQKVKKIGGKIIEEFVVMQNL